MCQVIWLKKFNGAIRRAILNGEIYVLSDTKGNWWHVTPELFQRSMLSYDWQLTESPRYPQDFIPQRYRHDPVV